MVTDAPRSHSPDIELGTYTSQHLGRLGQLGFGFVILRLVIFMSGSQPLPNLPEDTRSTL
jgi:hypothetical protein